MISLEPQIRVPVDPTETFYFLGTWSDKPMSKCTCAFPCGGTECGPTKMSTGFPTEASGVTPVNQEIMDGPLPPWAIGRAKGEYVLGAQLPTRDGRTCGNGHIVNIDALAQVYTVLSDAGSELYCLKEELMGLFYPPVWVSNVKDVWRKFGPEPEPDPGTQCCKRAKASNGWHHNDDCENWVLVY